VRSALLKSVVHVFEVLLLDAIADVVEEKLILEIHQGVAAVALRGGLADVPAGRGPAETGEVISRSPPGHSAGRWETARR